MKRSLTNKIATTGILGTLSALLYLFVKFSLPFFPSWLDIQISEVPALIAGFAYGPFSGSLVLLIRLLIKLPMTTSFGIGEFTDLLISLALIIPSSLIYKKNKSIKNAIISFVIGSVISIIVAVLCNIFISLPFYIKFAFDNNVDNLIGALNNLFKNINASNYITLYILGAVIPFNALRYVLVGIVTFLIYKRTHKLLDKIK